MIPKYYATAMCPLVNESWDCYWIDLFHKESIQAFQALGFYVAVHCYLI